VRNHPGATTEDLIDHIKPILRKNPDVIIVHGGTNDCTNNTDTIKNIVSINKLITKSNTHTKLVMSKIITRKDKVGLEKKVKEVNGDIDRWQR